MILPRNALGFDPQVNENALATDDRVRMLNGSEGTGSPSEEPPDVAAKVA